MDTCAHCGRKLLSHISARCNLCGGEIDDPNYQAQAEAGRAAYFAEQALHDLQSLSLIRGNDSLAVGMTAPAERIYWQKQAAYEAEKRQPHIAPVPEAPIADPEDETRERFGHLEI